MHCDQKISCLILCLIAIITIIFYLISLPYSTIEFLRNDVLRRRKYYISDWMDAFKKKRQVIPVVLFLYFACLAPAVSFGTISSEITNGSIGVVEFLLSSGVAGMVRVLISPSRPFVLLPRLRSSNET